jgi:hypothetical protein
MELEAPEINFPEEIDEIYPVKESDIKVSDTEFPKKTIESIREKESELKSPQKPKKDKVMSDAQKVLEELYAEFEKLKNESKELQMRAKDIKEEIINIMNEKGYDEVIINGLDSVVMLSITFPEREVLNKKALSEALNIKQKELSKPEVIIELTKEGKITTDMIALYTEIEERMQFSAQEYNPHDE